MKTKSSRGFFFVLISFILIMYIFLYLAAWINAMEISEKTSSEKFRAASIEGIVSQLSEDRFNEFFEISGYYALFRINEHAGDIAHPMKYNASDQLYHLRSAFFEASLAGESDEFEAQNLSYSSRDAETYTFYSWLDNLNSTLSQAGLDVKSFEIYDANFTQTSPVTFNASMNVSIFVQDSLSTISVNRTFRLEKEFNITGFTDPMIRRETQRIFGAQNATEKQIFFMDIEPDSLAPAKIAEGGQGQGFFYGPMIYAGDVTTINPPESERGLYILVGNYSDITNNAYAWQQFGAYVLTNEPGTDSHDGCQPSETDTFYAITYSKPNAGDPCTEIIENSIDAPFAVIKDFNLSAFSGPGGENHALIIANSSIAEVQGDVLEKNKGVAAYDIEKLRDATVCAYFLPSGRAPSYAQRLSRDAPGLRNDSFGIETLLVGKWAGGTDLVDYDNYSRVDFEFFSKTEGTKVRGMPGCKEPAMCSMDVGENAPLGHFRMSRDSLDFYGIKDENDISCDDGRAGCDG